MGWLFLLFALAAVAVAIVLLRRLQKARADLARTEADRAGLQAREAALPLARIRWRSGGSFTLDEKAAGLLNGRPDNIEALLALLAEPDRAVIGAGLAKLDRDGTAFTGTAKSFARPANSGATLTRSFCPECGTPLVARSSRAPDLLILPVGLFGEAAADWYLPNQLIFARSHRDWDLIDPSLPQHATYRDEGAMM